MPPPPLPPPPPPGTARPLPARDARPAPITPSRRGAAAQLFSAPLVAKNWLVVLVRQRAAAGAAGLGPLRCGGAEEEGPQDESADDREEPFG